MIEKEFFEHTPDVLDWRDLSGDEVYHIANLEHEARSTAAKFLSKAAFNTKGTKVATIKAQYILSRNDGLALSWLHTQAHIRNMSVAPVLETEIDDYIKSTSFKHWFDSHLKQLPEKTRGKELASDAKISQAYFSGMKNGSVTSPSNETVIRLASAFGKRQGLEGDELRQFITSSVNSLGVATNNIELAEYHN